MEDRKLRELVHGAMDSIGSNMKDDPCLAQRILIAARKQEGPKAKSDRKVEVVAKRKLSASFVLLITIMVLSVTALAAGILMSTKTQKVAELDAKGLRVKWGLKDKYAFVMAMRESGYPMEESDWILLSDESKSATDREAAADRIVYARYGAVQEEANALAVAPLDSMVGAMPDVVEIFREHYLAENPHASEQDYLDALGYWLRDEYMPAYQAALDKDEVETAAASAVLAKESAESFTLSYLTEVLSWSATAADQAVMTSQQDPDSGAWCVTVKGAGGEVTRWIALADDGDYCHADTLELLLADVAFTNRQIAQYTIHEEEAETIAKAALADKYRMDENALNRYFIFTGDHYYSDPNCIRVGILFRTHNRMNAPWDYAAIINLTTGKADDLFTANELMERLPILAAAWDSLQENDEWRDYFRWYTTWNPVGDNTQWPFYTKEEAEAVFQTLIQPQ